jgi:hypothetical protein
VTTDWLAYQELIVGQEIWLSHQIMRMAFKINLLVLRWHVKG